MVTGVSTNLNTMASQGPEALRARFTDAATRLGRNNNLINDQAFKQQLAALLQQHRQWRAQASKECSDGSLLCGLAGAGVGTCISAVTPAGGPAVLVAKSLGSLSCMAAGCACGMPPRLSNNVETARRALEAYLNSPELPTTQLMTPGAPSSAPLQPLSPEGIQR